MVDNAEGIINNVEATDDFADCPTNVGGKIGAGPREANLVTEPESKIFQVLKNYKQLLRCGILPAEHLKLPIY